MTGDDGADTRGAWTAVVVVHGIGNQRPLATLRGLVDALYTRDPDLENRDTRVGDLAARRVWVGLDRRYGSDADLPVLTTARIDTLMGERNVDFHEFYWAAQMAETRFTAVPLWLFELVKKGPGKMLPGVRILWPLIGMLLAFWILSATLLVLAAASWALDIPPFDQDGLNALLTWGAAAAVCAVTMGRRGVALLFAVLGVSAFFMLAAAIGCAIAQGQGVEMLPAIDGTTGGHRWPMAFGSRQSLWTAAVAIAAFIAFNTFFLLTVVGDVARYLRNAPSNIAVRRAIRAQGADMLRGLHDARTTGGKPRYDRIIVVAHSLGTMVAYDVLRAYWSMVSHSLGDPHKLAVGASQDRLDVETDDDRTLWRRNCRALVRELDARQSRTKSPRAAKKPRWVVTDFITLGSPLAQAEFLMADGTTTEALGASFERKWKERELPRCPARLQDSDGHLSFPFSGEHRFHNAALFGLTRWTNLYFPVRKLLWGDPVGGTVATNPAGGEIFGKGICDEAVDGAPAGNLFGHIHYWDVPKGPAPQFLVRLRDAVNLRDV